MVIDNLTKTVKGGRARLEASVSWEDSDRPQQKIYFETLEAFFEDLATDPDAFVVGCSIPALHYGEKRLLVEGEVCPDLKEGIATAMSLICHWFYSDRRPVAVEAKSRSAPSNTRKAGRSGFFFSGGIDSFATLRTNRLNIPPGHPQYIKDGLIVYGFEVDSPEAFDCVLRFYSKVSEELGITLIPAYTNVYLEYRREDALRNFAFWTEKFEGAALSAVAHAFAGRFRSVTIAGSHDIAHLGHTGTHPLLDPNYGSADLVIRYDGMRFSRLDKARLVSDWDVALQNLRVCPMAEQYSPERLNCGNCPKCVKTMLELMVTGALKRSRAFPKGDVTAEQILKKALIHDPYSESSYAELVGPLRGIGRDDLASAVEMRIREYHYGEPFWKKKVKEFDGRFLNGNLRRVYAGLRSLPSYSRGRP